MSLGSRSLLSIGGVSATNSAGDLAADQCLELSGSVGQTTVRRAANTGNRSTLPCMAPMKPPPHQPRLSSHSIRALLGQTSSFQTMTSFISISK
jgi:hypothetical protein